MTWAFRVIALVALAFVLFIFVLPVVLNAWVLLARSINRFRRSKEEQ